MMPGLVPAWILLLAFTGLKNFYWSLLFETRKEFAMNKINWKVRFKNKVWLGSFLSLIVGFVYNLLALFDIFPVVTQSVVGQMINQVLTFLGLIGVIVDPTTAGLEDSVRAMGYEEPWDDNR